MQIELKRIKIKDVVAGYKNNNEEGVIGFSGKLNIRPSYQREFVYSPKQQEAVINSIQKNYPLNVIYWVVNENGYEILDGQQRTLSICSYVNNEFSKDYKFFFNLTKEEQEQILDYELMIYFCEGTEREKLDWFQVVNISGEKLTNQELLNAIYTGQWLNSAKKYFSKTNCVAWNVGKDYVTGSPIRQDYLETVLNWISEGNIQEYMAKNQHNTNADDLWLYFQNVINWVRVVFPNYRKEMKGVNWGKLYNQYHKQSFDAKEIEKEITLLMQDEDVTKKQGIYLYMLTKDEKYLNIRAFTEKQKREVYEKQKGICPITNEYFSFEEMEADHITPFSKGGRTTIDNLQMICKKANRTKSNK